MFRLFNFSSTGRAVGVFCVTALLLAFCAATMFGQSSTTAASLSGIVTDPQGARVSGATVTITSVTQSFTRTFTTDASGAYSFTLLPPSVYNLKAEAAGFKKYGQNNITLEVGQAGVVNVNLAIGSTQETVEVTGQAPLLNADNANIATEISGKQIIELPLNYRNPFFLTFLDSSVRNIDQGYMGAGLDNNDQAVAFLTFGGQFLGWTSYMLDGGWDTDLAFGLVAYVPSVDDIQEFKVQSNSFTAQYGQSAGNVINVVTKSGSSQFHGDAYEFYRNDALDARYYFDAYNGRRKPNLHLNQFGASEGGPLYIPGVSTRKDRTFFFGLYEGYRYNAVAGPGISTTPTSDFKSGNLSGILGPQLVYSGTNPLAGQPETDALCNPVFAGEIFTPVNPQTGVTATCPSLGPNNTIIPAGATGLTVRHSVPGNRIDTAGLITPVAANLMQYFPTPTGSTIYNNFYAFGAIPTTFNEMDVRIDHNVTDSARIYGRFSQKWETQTSTANLYGSGNPGGPGQKGPNNRYSVALGYSQAFSPTLTASVNLGFQRWVQAGSGQGSNFAPSTVGLPAALDSITPVFPKITFSDSALTSQYVALGNTSKYSTPDNIGSISADITKVLHTHTLSFGYIGAMRQVNSISTPATSFSFTQAFTAGPNPLVQTPGTGDPFASFLLGYAASGGTSFPTYLAKTQISHGLYLQDDWKATRKLTLNLGVRYDIQLSPTERYNRQAYFDPTAVNPITSLVSNGTTYLGALVYNTSSNRGLIQTHYTNFSPRVGFAYQVFNNLVARGGFGIFYPTDYWNLASDPGYAQATSYVSSLDNGVTPAPGYNLSTPFPNGILSPTGNADGKLTNVGQTITSSILQKTKSPYVEQWSFGLQYSPSRNDVIEATYIGNHVNHLLVGNGINLNELNPSLLSRTDLTTMVTNPFFSQSAVAGSACGLQNAQVEQFQLLLPMPQFCDNVSVLQPTLGFSLFNSMQLKYTHRAKNLTFIANYTLEKWIDDASANPAGNDIFYTSITRNNYDLKAEKSLDEWNIPNAAVISLIYDLPFGRGQKFGSNMNGAENAVLGGWEFSAINTFKQGSPIAPQANVNNGTLYGGNQHANIVGDPNVAGTVAGNPGCAAPTKIHTPAAWYNPCAFVVPSAGDFGNAPRYLSNLTAPGYAFTDLTIQKWFNFTESFRMQFRAEMFNAFNHPSFGGPFSNVGSSVGGVIAYADISRQMQFAVKFYW